MKTVSGTGQPYVLGIDLGVNSLGWSCLGIRADQPGALRDAGVEGDVEQGKDSSRAAVRRQKRQPRRQLERRARRQRKIFRLLQLHGLLPAGPCAEQAQIDAILAELDKQLRAKLIPGVMGVPGSDRIAAHVWPYKLRALALDQRLDPYALGRAFYHLAQRRGFLSNRKTDKDDEEAGKVKTGIAELSRLIEAAGKRTLGKYTLGKYFASLDPETLRIRQRWTARDMYTNEFAAIWTAQAAHHGGLLTPKLRRKLEQALFHQRPLKSAKGLVGRCELEPTRRHTALAMPLAQRFRLLAAVNNLLVYEPGGTKRGLMREERNKLVEALEREGDLTFQAIRDLLGFKKTRNRKDKATGQSVVEPGHGFNLEEGGEKKIPGNRTVSKLLPILGQRWQEMSERQREAMVQDIIEYQHPSALAKRFQERWKLEEAQAEQLAQVHLEQDYARFSRKALQRLVPRMEEGLSYMSARKDEYPASLEAKPVVDHLPPVLDAIKDLRNPAVCRALTELRKVINAVIRKHGKPMMIRLELARDLKQPRKQRESNWKRNREREDERTIAAGKIKAARLVVGEPNRDTIEKWLLADECHWLCPYTGKVITPETLLGPHTQFDVEHIVPFSISLDNTFMNKTICDTQFNRHRKQNRLPAECFDLKGEEWHDVLLRVRRFSGKAGSVKLERFQWTRENLPDDFTNRHLQDTRYASRLAGDYLGLLYGGSCDEDGKRRVQVSAGGVTAYLRSEWGLNGILNDGGYKTRDDHRHHAVDAIAIALTSPATVKQLSDAAEHASQTGRRRFAQIAEPWVGFLDQVRDAIGGIVVSHRTNHRINGALHEETNYSKPHAYSVADKKTGKIKKSEVRHVRKPLVNLSANEVEEIVDVRVKELVKAKLGDQEPKKVFADPRNFPVITAHDGRTISIKKARIRKVINAIAVGSAQCPRYVAPGSNHHMAIVACVDPAGNETKWEGHLVSRFEAMQRLRRGEPVVQRKWDMGRKFKFSLSPGDTIRASIDRNESVLLLVTGISDGEVTCRRTCDARLATVVRKLPSDQKKNALFRPSPPKLKDMNAEKVIITPIGEVYPCHD